jgi:hypothetical protein
MINRGGIMTTKLQTLICILALATALAGCGGSQSEQAKNQGTPGEQPATAQTAPASTESAPASSETQPAAGEAASATSGAAATGALVEGSHVSLAGTTGCAHCTFKVGTECATAVKTASGDIIVLDGVPKDSELFTNREASRNIQLTGIVVASGDGLRHVKMESFQVN